jgi:hypothetical protein
MAFRVALIALIAVFSAAGSGTAEFTTPSLDQWGDGVKRVGEEQGAAGRHANAAWVAPSSIALVSGAPVGLGNLSQGSVSNLAAGEELVLVSGYERHEFHSRVYDRAAPPVAEVYAVHWPGAGVTPTVVTPVPTVVDARTVVTTPSVVAPSTVTVPPSAQVVYTREVKRVTYAHEVAVPEGSAVAILADERAPAVILSPSAVHVIRDNAYAGYSETIVTPSVVR